ncbi:MAG: hypothetical protein AB1403_00615 [Candidatus Riflebacteria bacterium]
MDIEREIARNRYQLIQAQAAIYLVGAELGLSKEKVKEIFEDAEEIASVEINKHFPDAVAFNKDNPKILGILKKLFEIRNKKPR